MHASLQQHNRISFTETLELFKHVLCVIKLKVADLEREIWKFS